MIQVHNLMEEIVIFRVNQLYDEVKQMGSKWLTCDCENCRTDCVNYVLNRISPRYIVGARGATYNAELLNGGQMNADVDTLALEGMRIVAATTRSFHQEEVFVLSEDEDCYFNFPVLFGSIFEGKTFEPLSGAKILLTMQNSLVQSVKVPMMCVSWENPISTFQSTKGKFTFWPQAIPATTLGEKKSFLFTVEISKEGYETVYHSFTVDLTSQKKLEKEMNSVNSFKIQDLYLFKPE